MTYRGSKIETMHLSTHLQLSVCTYIYLVYCLCTLLEMGMVFLFQNGTAYFGAIVGRVANRIAGGTFVVDQVRYNVTRNEGNNTLHGKYSNRCLLPIKLCHCFLFCY
jgi:hypothetical protein